jgi:hypothetical protein
MPSDAGQQAVAHATIYPEPEGGCSDNAMHLAAARPRKPQQPMGCVGQDGPERTRRVFRGLGIGGLVQMVGAG